MILGKYDFNPERKEWIGVIYEERGLTTTVLTIGCEQTKTEIKNWLRLALKLRPWESGEAVPDMYDRKKVN